MTKPKPKTVIMPISVTPDEKTEFKVNAKMLGMTVSEFVRFLRREWKDRVTKTKKGA